MAQPPFITIVIPVHNEADYLAEGVEGLYRELADVPAAFEVLLSENGSTDGTADVAEGLMARYPGLGLLQVPKADYGAAMRAGFRQAKGEWVVNFDVDYFSGTFLSRALHLAEETDIVLASKRAPGATDRRSPFRRLATAVFNMILRTLFRSSVSDTHGMKLVSREVVDSVVPLVRSTLDLFDTELVLRAERAGYRIGELPALVEEQRAARSSLMSRVPRTMLGLLKIRWWLWREN